MELEKQLALIRGLGRAYQTEEAVNGKIKRQALERLLRDEDNAVSGVPEMSLKRSSHEGLECHVQELVFDRGSG